MSKRTLSVRLAMVDGEGIPASAMFYRPDYRATCREEGIETLNRMLTNPRRCFRPVSQKRI